MPPANVQGYPKHNQGNDNVERQQSLLRKVQYNLIQYLHCLAFWYEKIKGENKKTILKPKPACLLRICKGFDKIVLEKWRQNVYFCLLAELCKPSK